MVTEPTWNTTLFTLLKEDPNTCSEITKTVNILAANHLQSNNRERRD